MAERPGPNVQVREVIDSMMAAVHRDYLNTPEHPFLGALCAMRFLSSTHQAASFEKQGGPPAFERYLRQPHKQARTSASALAPTPYPPRPSPHALAPTP